MFSIAAEVSYGRSHTSFLPQTTILTGASARKADTRPDVSFSKIAFFFASSSRLEKPVQGSYSAAASWVLGAVGRVAPKPALRCFSFAEHNLQRELLLADASIREEGER
jgi:hypothetical protein